MRMGVLKRRLSRRVAERIERLALLLENAKRGVLSKGGERLLREPSMRLDQLRSRLVAAVQMDWRDRRFQLKSLRRSLEAQRPELQIEQRLELIRRMRLELGRAAAHQFVERRDSLKRLGSLLRALGPESAFERGFSIATTPDGMVIRSVKDVTEGGKFVTKLRDGEIRSRRVREKE